MGDWTDKEIKDLRYMASERYKMKDIIDVLGKPKHEIAFQMKVLNIKLMSLEKKKGELYYCPRCNKYLLMEKYSRNKTSKYGISTYCKKCDLERKQEERKFKAIKEIIGEDKSKLEVNKNISTKICTKCRDEKTVDSFNWAKKGIKLQPHCKECHRKETHINKMKRLKEKGY